MIFLVSLHGLGGAQKLLTSIFLIIALPGLAEGRARANQPTDAEVSQILRSLSGTAAKIPNRFLARNLLRESVKDFKILRLLPVLRNELFGGRCFLRSAERGWAVMVTLDVNHAMR